MGYLSLVLGAAGLGFVALPGAGKYLALTFGLLALGAGAWAWRRHEDAARLVGAAGVTLGALAVLFGGAKLAITILAIERLGTLFGT